MEGGPVIQLLVQWKSELNNDNAAGRLCDAASAGDLDTLKLILEHGVDPNCGDYDSRTPLHLAAAEGQDKAVQYLIAKGADVNSKDRWDATPLQDAVQSGHLQVAEQILSRGGFMTTEMGPVAMCNAATEGDVRYLKLLIRCGVNPDVGDYDNRCPMHLAAAEGRLLAVSYLLGVSANPNGKDRWGGTPMDDCVRGGTQRHLQCAKLLQCLGGNLGTLAGTPEGHSAMSTLNKMDMEDVRKVIKLLIDQGLDSKKPERATHQQCVVAYEASGNLMQPANEIKRVFDIVTNLLKQEQSGCKELLGISLEASMSVAKFADKIQLAHAVRNGSGKDDGANEHLYENDVAEFKRVLESGEDAESLDHFFDFEIDQATLLLYDELDSILAEQERDKFGSRSMRVMLAKDFNRCLMNIWKVEEMWRIIRVAFFERVQRSIDSAIDAFGATSSKLGQQSSMMSVNHLGLDMKGLGEVLNYFDMHFTEDENRQVFRQATEAFGCSLVNPETLLAGSALFQHRVLEDDSDDIAQLLYRSIILRVLSWQNIQLLCPHARRVKLKEGQTIRLKDRSIVAVQTGSVKVTYLDAAEQKQVHHVGRDEVVGEPWAILGVGRIVNVLANATTSIVLLPWKAFGILFEMRPELFITVCTSFVDLAWPNDEAAGAAVETLTGKQRETPRELSFRPFEVEMIRSVYSSTDKKKSAVRSRASINMDELKELQGKDKSQQDRDNAVRRLMDFTRVSCAVEWVDSPNKPALLALLRWRMAFKTKVRKRSQAEEHERRLTLRDGFNFIEGSWDILANGANTIFFTQLESLRDHLGEVGMHFFDAAFPSEKMKEEIYFKDWVICWIRYLDGDEEEGDPVLQQLGVASASQELTASVATTDNGQQKLQAGGSRDDPKSGKKKSMEIDDAEESANIPSNWILRHLHNVYTKVRHTPITPLLDDTEIAHAYEPSYIATTGDLKNILDRKRVKEFLALLLIDFDQQLTRMHVTEFMQMFSPDGPKGQSVAWVDIERGLRERTNKGIRPDRLFMSGIGSPLNPNSIAIRCWHTVMQTSALYFFIHVPVRIAFNPYPSMDAWQFVLLPCDLGADVLVFVNLIVTFNTAYMNKKSRWVIDRGKIARHYLSSEFWVDLLVATPFDWFGFLSGASQRLSSCFRLPKMFFVMNAFNESREGLIPLRTIAGQIQMLTKILMLLHVATCVFFLLGNDGPEDVWTWYRFPQDGDVEVNGVEYGDGHWPYEYSGFGYLQDPDNSALYRVWKQYLLSFYWVTSTVTTTGVIGDMHPKNYMEVVFTMVTLLVNLTLFSYVIGQVSASVLKGDEKLLKAREELGAVESYLHSFDFPDDLKLEIKRYFQGANASSFLSASEIFDSVSQSLRLEMSSDLTRKCLDNCTLFSGCSKQMKDSIKGLLREVHFASEEYLLQINTVAHDMYFVMSGKVEQVNIDTEGVETVEARIGPGGSVGILASYFGIRYMYSARATSLAGPCLCLRLVRNQLMPILKAYPDDEEIVAQNAMSEFQKVKQEKSVNGNSTKGRSVKSGRSGARSVQSERRIIKKLEDEEQKSVDGSDRSLDTAYENEAGDKVEQSVDAIILSGIEQKLASLNQRRKAERVAQFCSAASRGEIEKIARGMRNGVHIDETDINGRTALHCAASEGQVDMVRYLIEARASINISDNYKNTPLNDAVRHKHDLVAQELRKFGSMPIMLPGYEMGVQMCTFAFEGKQEQLQRMLTNGVDVNTADYDKRTALHLAASQGHVSIVEFLVAHNAEVNCTDRMGFSPLVDALRHDHVAVQKLLRSKGGQLLGMDVSVELCNAAAAGDVPRMKALIENGANPNAGDYDDRTALHLAASNGETSALDYMLRHLSVPININPLDRLGGTPMEDAHRHGQMVAVAMLQDAGGLRQDNPELVAMAEKVRADTELIQRRERYGKVQDLVSSAPETRACVWVRGRCGKLLPGQVMSS